MYGKLPKMSTYESNTNGLCCIQLKTKNETILQELDLLGVSKSTPIFLRHINFYQLGKKNGEVGNSYGKVKRI